MSEGVFGEGMKKGADRPNQSSKKKRGKSYLNSTGKGYSLIQEEGNRSSRNLRDSGGFRNCDLRIAQAYVRKPLLVITINSEGDS